MFCAFSLGIGSLTACNISGNESVSTEESQEPLKYSAMVKLHTPEVPEKKILDILAEKTNMDLDIQFVPATTYVEKVNTLFSTGSFPDSVVLDLEMLTQYKEAIRDGQFWEIGPYLDDYENLSKMRDDVLENTKVDDKIYMIYEGKPLSRQGIIYRKDWAENLGLSAPKNTEEFYEMLRAFTEDDPDGNGKDDTIGLTDRNELIFGAFKTVASWFHTPNNFGVKDGKIVPEFMFPEYMETLDFFRKLHKNGYINKDFPVTSKTDQQAMLSNGTAGVYVGSMGDVQSLYTNASEINPNAELDVHNQVAGPDGKFTVWSLPGYGNAILFPKSSVESEEELKKILSFYDYLMTPEGANLIYWGIEGEHYTIKDGMANIKDQNLFDREVLPIQTLEIAEQETNGRLNGYFTYEPKAKAEELFKDNEQYLIPDPTIGLDSPTFVEKSASLQQIIDDATYKYIIGDIDKKGFQAAVDQWKKQGGDKIIEEFSASYKKEN
ncbi:extracellular solute-binding protein [Metabacillus arenae]|uniref:Extracellular solute-binding protein n=1 Tax=Metabacillus arenae TaxID=2771434 RepID=A0A926RZV1_9BACI|nr:extracellular solute-binding protein [Metabacillus arenae]MBD1379414.1 extracellular solute-binding protein [Metabacillus arenae]